MPLDMHYKARGYALVDILIAISMSTILVILLTIFIRDSMQFVSYVEKHRQLRSEVFTLMNFTLPLLIREATGVDSTASKEGTLSLFLDPFEKKKALITSSASQLILQQKENTWYLSTGKIEIESLQFQWTPKPSGKTLQEDRVYQPLVRVRIVARAKRPEGFEGRTVFSFFEDPRVSYEAVFSLRNYSFSSLRS